MDVFHHFPLNQAHLNERKAERCLKQHNWTDAIVFYEQAKCYILKAIDTVPPDPRILQSLKYQLEFYSNQPEIVKIKQQEYEEEERNQHLCSSPIDGSSSANAEDVCDMNADFQLDKRNIDRSNMTDNSTVELECVQNYRENDSSSMKVDTDSLLYFLHNSIKSPTKFTHKKFPKGEKERVEELEIQNEHLTQLVSSLMQSNKTLEQQNQTLIQENAILRKDMLDMQTKLNSITINENRTIADNSSSDEESPNSPIKSEQSWQNQNTIFEEQTCFEFQPSLIEDLNPALTEELLDSVQVKGDKNSGP